MNRIPIFIIGLFVVCCVGCAYNPGPNTLAPGKTIPAKAGSTYTFKNVQIDTNGHTIDSTAYFTRDSVDEVGITYFGKTNVTHLTTIDQRFGYSVSEQYINYETNGDISIYSGGAGGLGLGGGNVPDWITYCVQSHQLTSFKFADTTIDFNGVPLHLTAFDSVVFVNNGTYHVGSTTLAVINMKQTATITGTVVVVPLLTQTLVQHLSFAPSIGYYADQKTDPSKNPAGPSSQGNEVSLTSYTLR